MTITLTSIWVQTWPGSHSQWNLLIIIHRRHMGPVEKSVGHQLPQHRIDFTCLSCTHRWRQSPNFETYTMFYDLTHVLATLHDFRIWAAQLNSKAGILSWAYTVEKLWQEVTNIHTESRSCPNSPVCDWGAQQKQHPHWSAIAGGARGEIWWVEQWAIDYITI